MQLRGSLKIDEKGDLRIGGISASQLVKEFGSPLWVIDEKALRDNCRTFKNAFPHGTDYEVAYASKALNNLAILRIIDEEGLSLDVVSGGELFTALQAGLPPESIYFHGNNKSVEELQYAVEANIGRIIVDNFYELNLLQQICTELGRVQSILLRLSPGIETDTHEFIQTGQIDSKFGFTMSDGTAMSAVVAALKANNLSLTGIHCHIGSQIFDSESFSEATNLMMDFLAEIKAQTGHECSELNMGGGFGIYYTSTDKHMEVQEIIAEILRIVKEKSVVHTLAIPKVIIEPGRAIVGPAGTTLYTVGACKEIKGIRKYVSIDGGMTDNPRPALYDAKYSALLANKANDLAEELVSIAGKCCESGDMLMWDIRLPKVEPGDILAVLATGAYNYSMSSNYNRIPKPAMVLVNNGQADLIVKGETYEDLVRNDLIPERLRK